MAISFPVSPHTPFKKIMQPGIAYRSKRVLAAFPLNLREFYTMITAMEERIGSVIKFFEKTSIAAVKLDFGDLSVGDTIRVKGPITDFTQKIDDLEFDHQPVQKAIRGQFTGIKLSQQAKPFDLVYKITG